MEREGKRDVAELREVYELERHKLCKAVTKVDRAWLSPGLVGAVRNAELAPDGSDD